VKRIAAFLILFTSLNLNAQNREVQTNFEIWYGVMTNTKFSKNWSVWNDAHFVNNLFFIYRTGLTYHTPNNRFVITGGYGWLRLGAPFSDGNLIRTEHRPWYQVVYRVPSKSAFSVSFRYRYDARFRQDFNRESQEMLNTFTFNSRHRFNMGLRYNWGNVISPNANLITSFLNESLLMTGEGIDGINFEHRTHFLLGHNVKGNTYSLGYVVRFLPQNENLLRINHGLVFWMTLNFVTKKMMARTFNEYPADHAE
jgi:hypothetical protein